MIQSSDLGRSLRMPAPLRPGNRVAIVAPASKIEPRLITDAASVLAGIGFEPVIMPHAAGSVGSFSASVADRLSDMELALRDEGIAAILCARGGYGAVHLLPELDKIPAACFDKWLIGFSDITALHCLWQRKGVASLHAAMAKYIGRGEAFDCFADEMAVLRGRGINYSLPSHGMNRAGEASGVVVGGNLAVFGGLIGTPYDPFETIFTAHRIDSGELPRPILFIEDVAEPIYKVERILWQLRLRGIFHRIAALLVGRFTEYRPSADHPDMTTMIHRFLSNLDSDAFPVAFELPFGHIEANRPLLFGRPTSVSVTAEAVLLSQN